MVVGPTGSGKSTTLACRSIGLTPTEVVALSQLKTRLNFTHHSKLATIDQREVQSDTKSFANALKYILRQDPDVILIGEMRDQETISAALTAVETGHLVFATLHTNDAVQTIDRIVDVFHVFSKSKLVLDLLCWRLYRKDFSKISDYTGRIPAFEIMIGSNAIRNLIRENKMHQALSVMETSKGMGMCTMDMSLKKLLLDGHINQEEVMRYAKNSNLYKMKVKSILLAVEIVNTDIHNWRFPF